MAKKLNWNSIVKVKLTERGKEIYRAQYDELNAKQAANGRMIFDRPEPHVDKDGYTTFQLWCFMELYGPYIGMGRKAIADSPDFYIFECDLEEVKENVEMGESC